MSARRKACCQRLVIMPDTVQSLPRNMRVLLLPPTSRDAEAIQKLLCREGFQCEICASMADVCMQIAKGVGAIFVSEEALYTGHPPLAECVAAQPVWSD